MILNHAEIDLIISELKNGTSGCGVSEDGLEGCWLKKIRQPDYSGIIFEFTKNKTKIPVYIAVKSPEIRIHRYYLSDCLKTMRNSFNFSPADTADSAELLPEKLPQSLPKPPRFTAVLKSRIEGAKLTEIKQLGSDRIVRFTFFSDKDTLFLDAKLWGSGANIILSDYSGKIIDAYSRRPYKKEIPGEYWPPENIGKTENTGKNKIFTIRDFPLNISGYISGTPGNIPFNLRLFLFYRGIEHKKNAERIRDAWRNHLEKRKKYLLQKIETLSRQIQIKENEKTLTHYGDIISAEIFKLEEHIKKTGSLPDNLETEDWENPGTEIIIPLDKSISPGENAQKYYNRAKKAAKAAEVLHKDLKSAEKNLAEVQKLIERLEKGDTGEPFNKPPDNLEDSSGLSYVQGITSVTGKKQKKNYSGIRILDKSCIIAVGRSAKESDELLRNWAKGNDYWMHLRDRPGAHVFIRSAKNKSIPLDVLLDAGNLALYYSARNLNEADLYYTRVKYLRRAKNGKTGTVIPTNEKNLHIISDTERLEKLKLLIQKF